MPTKTLLLGVFFIDASTQFRSNMKWHVSTLLFIDHC
jgi:hypothetical protein